MDFFTGAQNIIEDIEQIIDVICVPLEEDSESIRKKENHFFLINWKARFTVLQISFETREMLKSHTSPTSNLLE